MQQEEQNTEIKRDSVATGTSVVIEKSGREGSQTFTIVASNEANLAEGKISNLSPLGSALVGKCAGETVKVLTPNGEITYKIVSIE